jgi:RNA polymerase sigma-70 factor, ECF subfamily
VPVSPEEYAARAARGDASAFEALVDRFEGPLYRFLFLRTGDAHEAEELAQEAFLKAWRNIERYDSRWRFSTWLYTLAKRLAISRRRKARPEREAADSLEAIAVDEDPARIAGAREEVANLWELAARFLNREQRSALWLRYAEERGIDEIARILGRRRVTVRVILFRAREKLLGHLDVRGAGVSFPLSPETCPSIPLSAASVLARRAVGGRS